jgi:hypothetical protein
MGMTSFSGLSSNMHRWLVINDFCITPIHSGEVLQWYGNQKLPCMLYYTQVGAGGGEGEAAAGGRAMVL